MCGRCSTETWTSSSKTLVTCSNTSTQHAGLSPRVFKHISTTCWSLSSLVLIQTHQHDSNNIRDIASLIFVRVSRQAHTRTRQTHGTRTPTRQTHDQAHTHTHTHTHTQDRHAHAQHTLWTYPNTHDRKNKRKIETQIHISQELAPSAKDSIVPNKHKLVSAHRAVKETCRTGRCIHIGAGLIP